jgi:hypothetical protein
MRLAGALAVTAARAHAPYRCPERGGPTWIEARSTHFVVQTDLPPETIRGKLVELERLRTAIAMLWSAPPEQHPPIDLFVPRNAQEASEFSDRGPLLALSPFCDQVVVASGGADLAGEPLVKPGRWREACDAEARAAEFDRGRTATTRRAIEEHLEQLAEHCPKR